MNDYPVIVHLSALAATFFAGYLKGRIARAKVQSVAETQSVLEPRRDEFEVMSETLRTRLLTKRIISSDWAKENPAAVGALINRPVNLSIIRALVESPLPLSYAQINPGDRMLQTTFARAIRQLREAGLVVQSVSGRRNLYEVSPEHSEALRELLAVSDEKVS